MNMCVVCTCVCEIEDTLHREYKSFQSLRLLNKKTMASVQYPLELLVRDDPKVPSKIRSTLIALVF